MAQWPPPKYAPAQQFTRCASQWPMAMPGERFEKQNLKMPSALVTSLQALHNK